MTMDLMILNLGTKEFAGGLTYTGVTRVKKLEDLAFRPFPNYCRQILLHLLKIFHFLFYSDSLTSRTSNGLKIEEMKN